MISFIKFRDAVQFGSSMLVHANDTIATITVDMAMRLATLSKGDHTVYVPFENVTCWRGNPRVGSELDVEHMAKTGEVRSPKGKGR